MSAAAKMNHYQNAIGLSSILRRAIDASKNNAATNIDLGSVVSFSFDALRAMKPWGFIPTEMYSLLSSYPINHIRYIVANHEELGKNSLIYKLLGTHPKEAMNLLTYNNEPLTTLSIAQLILTSDYTKLGVRFDLSVEEEERLGKALKSFQTSTFMASKLLSWGNRAKARVKERDMSGQRGFSTDTYSAPEDLSSQPHLRAASRSSYLRAASRSSYRGKESEGSTGFSSGGIYAGSFRNGHSSSLRGEDYRSGRPGPHGEFMQPTGDSDSSDSDGASILPPGFQRETDHLSAPSSSFEAVREQFMGELETLSEVMLQEKEKFLDGKASYIAHSLVRIPDDQKAQAFKSVAKLSVCLFSTRIFGKDNFFARYSLPILFLIEVIPNNIFEKGAQEKLGKHAARKMEQASTLKLSEISNQTWKHVINRVGHVALSILPTATWSYVGTGLHTTWEILPDLVTNFGTNKLKRNPWVQALLGVERASSTPSSYMEEYHSGDDSDGSSY